MAPALIPIALNIAQQFAPHLLKFFGAGEQSVAAAERIVGMAQEATGSTSPEEAFQKLQIDAKAQHELPHEDAGAGRRD